MDQAVRIAYDKTRRWRVVTLAGQVIDTSGTMAGGGNTARKGRMGTQVRASSSGAVSANDIQKLERQLEEMQQRQQSLRRERGQLEAEIHNLTKKLNQAKLQCKKLKLGADNLTTEKAQLESRVQELSQSVNLSGEDAQKLKSLQQEQKSQSVSVAKAKKDTEALEKDIEKLQKNILDAGGAKLRTQKAKVESLANQLAETSKSITKMKVDIKGAATKIAKTEKDIQVAEKSSEKSDAKLAKLKEEFKQIENDAQKVLEAYQDAQKQLDIKAKELDVIQKDFEALQKVVESVKGVEVDITNKMDDFDRTIDDCNNKVKHWSKKLEELIKKIREGEAVIGIGQSPEEKDEKEAKEDMEEKVEEGPKKPAKRGRKGRQEEEEEPEQQETTKKNDGYSPMPEEEVAELDREEVGLRVTLLEEALGQLKPNMRAIAEYRKKEREYASRVEQLDETTKERDDSRKMYDGLRKKRLDEFMAGFSVITMKLKEMYQMLTLGGDAELELVDSLDPFSEGIVFSVRPPKKSWKNIQNLSGGEKTLSSLALVFALHHYKPTPLYVMDEIDAALDFKNVSIVANYIKERTKDAQFVIISLRNNMFELADRLVGIYKTENATKSISIDPRKFTVEEEEDLENNSANANTAAPKPMTTTVG